MTSSFHSNPIGNDPAIVGEATPFNPVKGHKGGGLFALDARGRDWATR